ncbi:hypothetical protein ACM26V_14130 [Salipaludibacillus sp. HK11]|uniref:hypothetical protein n=1 Tax=Salipaludibacillus sp. HK11 TaxID=3394320 RepID=UPI0039FC251C
MNKYLVASIIALSILVIIFGRYQYEQKLSDITTSAQQMLADQVDNFSEEPEEINQEIIVEPSEDPELNSEEGDSSSEVELDVLLEDTPSSLADRIEARLTANETITILAFGSESLTDSQNEGLVPWPELFMEKINEAFSTDLFVVETMSVGEMTSLDMVLQGVDQEVAEKNADIFLIEPLMWNDNGNVIIDHSSDHLTTLMNSISEENDEAVIVINPSQPAYETVNYPDQMESLRSLSIENNYLFVDHWSDWPGIYEEDLLEYVDENDHRMPTQMGHEQWSESILSYFVN